VGFAESTALCPPHPVRSKDTLNPMTANVFFTWFPAFLNEFSPIYSESRFIFCHDGGGETMPLSARMI
jgi:hypothetical protein